jgi:uncharacterized membrane protein
VCTRTTKEKRRRKKMMEKRATSPIPMDIMGPRDEEGSSVSSMRTAETLLRLVPMTLCIAALVVMVKNSQTNDFGSLSYSDLGAFRYIPHHVSCLLPTYLQFHFQLSVFSNLSLTNQHLNTKINSQITITHHVINN